MTAHSVFAMPFAKVYPMYVAKAERKARTKEEVDTVICWLTGYSPAALQEQAVKGVTLEEFFDQAPAFHPNAVRITGLVCGVRVEDVEHPLMRKIRSLDKLIDELAKGKTMEEILRK